MQWKDTQVITDPKARDESGPSDAEEARNPAEEFQALLDALPAVILISREPSAAHMVGNRFASEVLRMPTGSNLSQSAPQGERPRFRVFKGGVESTPEALPMQRAAATGCAVYDQECELAFDDGSTRTILGSAVPLVGPGGILRGAVGAFLDVTARRAAEKALAESEARFRAAIDAVQGILWTTNAAGEMEGEQPGWASLTGQALDEYQGWGWTKAIHPEEAVDTIEAWKAGVERHLPFSS